MESTYSITTKVGYGYEWSNRVTFGTFSHCPCSICLPSNDQVGAVWIRGHKWLDCDIVVAGGLQSFGEPVDGCCVTRAANQSITVLGSIRKSLERVCFCQQIGSEEDSTKLVLILVLVGQFHLN